MLLYQRYYLILFQIRYQLFVDLPPNPVLLCFHQQNLNYHLHTALLLIHQLFYLLQQSQYRHPLQAFHQSGYLYPVFFQIQIFLSEPVPKLQLFWMQLLHFVTHFLLFLIYQYQNFHLMIHYPVLSQVP